VPSRPDGWHASLVTVDVDWTRFTEADLVEATERLTRLSTALRLLAAGTGWDRPRGDTWTLREIADHVGNAWYAEQVGDLMPPTAPSPGAYAGWRPPPDSARDATGIPRLLVVAQRPEFGQGRLAIGAPAMTGPPGGGAPSPSRSVAAPLNWDA